MSESNVQYLSRDQAYDLLIENGADPEDAAEFVGAAEEFALSLDGDGSELKLSAVEPVVSEEMYWMLTDCIGSVIARQLNFQDWLGEHSWFVSLSRGTLELGEGRAFTIQVLGTESYTSDSWLWSWANEKAQLSESLTAAAEKLREIGTDHSVYELVRSRFPLQRVTGEEISMLAASRIERCCYFPCPYENGCMWVLLEEVPDVVNLPCSPPRIVTVTQMILDCPVVNRVEAVSTFLEEQGFERASDGETITYVSPDGCKVSIDQLEDGKVSCSFEIPPMP